MRQAILFIAIGIVAGIGMAALFDGQPALGPNSIDQPEPASRPAAGELTERVAALEAALAAESAQTAELRTTLAALAGQIGALSGGSDPAAEDGPAVAADAEATAADEPAERFVTRGFDRRRRETPEDRLARLLDAGFPPDTAQWVVDRESQQRMAMLNAQYEARRGGEPFNPFEAERADQAELRAQLGDAQYAQYLEASGRPASIPVREVLDSSPGQAAGLRAGDEIVSYAGQRVFNLAELNQLTLEGQPGETVAIDVVRNGQTMQLYVPRGPIGFTGAGRPFPIGPATFLP
jgi:membrane-associated protease RseP (regulator of RpoE activity)